MAGKINLQGSADGISYIPVDQGLEDQRLSLGSRQSLERREDSLGTAERAVMSNANNNPTLEEHEEVGLPELTMTEASGDGDPLKIGNNNVGGYSYQDVLGHVGNVGTNHEDNDVESGINYEDNDVEFGINHEDNDLEPRINHEDTNVEFLASSQPKKKSKAGQKSKCLECDVMVSTTNMSRHIRQHHCEGGAFYNSGPARKARSAKIKCEFCGKNVAKNYLAKHIKVIHQNKDKKCSWCDLVFSFKGSLVDHMRVCRNNLS